MKKIILGAVILGSLSLASCGGKGDDKLADRVEDRAVERADMLDNKADQMEENADQLHDKADMVEETGEDRSNAIDAADVNADAMTDEQKQAIVDQNAPAVK